MTKKTAGTDTQDRTMVHVRPFSYQPSKAELEEDVSIDATPDELAEAVLRPVRMVGDENA